MEISGREPTGGTTVVLAVLDSISRREGSVAVGGGMVAAGVAGAAGGEAAVLARFACRVSSSSYVSCNLVKVSLFLSSRHGNPLFMWEYVGHV